MFELQSLIFEKIPTRMELLNYKSKETNRKFTISIYRNHSFEMIEHTISAYLDFANINVEFKYSDYDDSLTFFDLDIESDLVILWLDFTRYANDSAVNFVKERIHYLSQKYKKNILFVPFESDISIEENNVIVYDLNNVKKELNDKYKDERLEQFSGTKLSPASAQIIAKDLGLNYIPTILLSNIKAIVLDLDNTLYKGVLGEDGINGIVLEEGHRKLQENIVSLAQKGFFICIASKNEEQDVLEMFEQRKDFPLKLEHITKHMISWNSKSDSIEQIRKFLNISSADMLFIDDNIGEIAQVLTKIPDINVILAKEDANITLNVLKNYPRMLKFKTSREDSIRQKDTQANLEREQMRQSLSQEEFLKSLEINLSYRIDKREDISRLSQLSNKTNQFICSYKRYSEKEVSELIQDKNSLVVAIALKDKLSDSGIIGCLTFKNLSDYVEIEEAFISCRALGRGIDDLVVLYPIQLALQYFNKSKIKFSFTKGERNLPAEKFLNNNLKEYINKIAFFNKSIDSSNVNTLIERD